MSTETPEVRTGQGSTKLPRAEFQRRYRAQFVDPAFDAAKPEIERLVCADRGNPDPTSTHGKEAAEGKAIELKGWVYPKHLAGRIFR